MNIRKIKSICRRPRRTKGIRPGQGRRSHNSPPIQIEGLIPAARPGVGRITRPHIRHYPLSGEGGGVTSNDTSSYYYPSCDCNFGCCPKTRHSKWGSYPGHILPRNLLHWQTIRVTLVSTRIRIPQRIIADIRVPIPPLRTARLRHNRVRADKPPQHRRIILTTHRTIVRLGGCASWK